MPVKERDVLVGRRYLMSTGETRIVLRAIGDRIEYSSVSNTNPTREKDSREAFAAAAQREVTY